MDLYVGDDGLSRAVSQGKRSEDRRGRGCLVRRQGRIWEGDTKRTGRTWEKRTWKQDYTSCGPWPFQTWAFLFSSCQSSVRDLGHIAGRSALAQAQLLLFYVGLEVPNIELLDIFWRKSHFTYVSNCVDNFFFVGGVFAWGVFEDTGWA